MKKSLACLLLILALLASRQVWASGCRDSTRTGVYANYAVAFQIGTTGAGIQLARHLPTRARLIARLGLSCLANQRAIGLGTGAGKLEIKPSFVQAFTLASLKWHPFRRGSFFITAGGGYAWQPSLNLMIRAKSKIMFGGLEVTPENVGTIDARFDWSHPVGYVSFGFGRSVPYRRLGFSAEFGCYYLGIPKIDLQYEGFLETTTIQEQIPTIQRNLSGYRYLPSIQLAITYALFW